MDAYIMNTYYIYLLLGWVDVCGKFPPPEKRQRPVESMLQTYRLKSLHLALADIIIW